ncbi:MAG: hypothetical protein JXR81_05180 [Candidatus Goldbacteria bacterium]|nr:hypothetical protein [Candidatus Goldiibacteriota bacterium]
MFRKLFSLVIIMLFMFSCSKNDGGTAPSAPSASPTATLTAEWKQIASKTITGRIFHTDLKLLSGLPYVAITESTDVGVITSHISVLKTVGNSLEYLGSPKFVTSTHSGATLNFLNYSPCIAYTEEEESLDYGASFRVYTGIGASGWEFLGSRAYDNYDQDIDMFVYNNIPYMTYKDFNNGNKLTVKKYVAAGTTGWESVGSPGFSSEVGLSSTNKIWVQNGIEYVAYTDVNNKIKVMQHSWIGSTGWTYISDGMPEHNGCMKDIAIDNGIFYVAYKDYDNLNKISVLKCQNGLWSFLGSSGFSNGEVQFVNITASNNDIFVAYTDESENYKVLVKKYKGAEITGWESVGETSLNYEGSNVSMESSDGYLFLTFTNNTEVSGCDEIRIFKFE